MVLSILIKESGVVENRFASLLEAEAVQKMNLVVVQHQNILHSDEEASKGSELTKEHNVNSLTEERVLSEYAEVFRGLDKTGGKLHLEVDDKVTPVVIPPRHAPVTIIKVRLKKELDHLETLEVIRRELDEPTEWVSSMVVTRKPNGKVRVCFNPKHLNQAWKRRH